MSESPPSSSRRLRTEIHDIDVGTGWTLSLKQVAPKNDAGARPVMIVPGYGMNSFIFGFHPSGASLEEHLASRGLEVWSVDLRGQGRSRRTHHAKETRFGLAELAIDDLGACIDHVLKATRTGRTEVDLIGCSLGAALGLAHLAVIPEAPIGAFVSLGGLVTWVKVHPALRAAFASPALVGRVNMKHTRLLAGLALPVVSKYLPALLSIYLNPESTDTRHAASMVQTVEDPNPYINRQIAHWIAQRELVVRGVNVSQAVPSMKLPFLGVVAHDDGIVPVPTARWAYDAIGASDKELVVVGGPGKSPIAHADLFLSHDAQETTFEPVARFLLTRSAQARPALDRQSY